ncbi:MAG TPA: 50S ribosomal protein L20 [Candidatus Paceibacterota bacterium]|nr:50S ribosomal protein L20 [Candidatus Paceibacterota bacterium]
MARVKKGTNALKRRKNILSQVKGYRFGRSTKKRMAKDAIAHAGVHAFRGRKEKKRLARQVFTLRINAAARENGFSYSKLIDALKKSGSQLDRKALAILAKDHPEAFARLAKQLQK